MAAGDSVSAALASAKKTLQSVSHSNVDTGGQHAWTRPSYSSAHMERRKAIPEASMAAEEKKPIESGLKKEATDVAQGLENRRKNVDDYVAAQKQQ